MDRGAIPLQVLDHSRASQATHPPTRWVLFSRRGGGDGISGLAPVSPRAKEEATHWVLFHDEGMATAFPASHLSRRGRRRKRRTGVVSGRGDGDGISGLAPVTPRAK